MTEWLPVSSSGHLVFAQELFDLPAGENLLFDLMVHLGTVLAVCVYFRKELWNILAAMTSRSDRSEQESQLRRLGAMIVVGTVPIAVLGLIISDGIEGIFDLRLVGIALLVNAAVLVLAERLSSERKKDIRLMDALVIGLFQAVAIIPGISRSGFSIAGGMSRGLQRETAATFAFLLSVPALLGAFAYGVTTLERYGADATTLVIGAVAAFAVGLVSIDYLLKAIRDGKLWIFGAYCVVVGVAAIITTL